MRETEQYNAKVTVAKNPDGSVSTFCTARVDDKWVTWMLPEKMLELYPPSANQPPVAVERAVAHLPIGFDPRPDPMTSLNEDEESNTQLRKAAG